MQGGLGDVDHGAAQVGGEAGLFVVAVHFVVLAAARRAQTAAFGAEVDVAGAVAFGFAHLQPLFFGERPAFASGMYQGARAIVVAAGLDVDVAVDRANQGRGGALDDDSDPLAADQAGDGALAVLFAVGLVFFAADDAAAFVVLAADEVAFFPAVMQVNAVAAVDGDDAIIAVDLHPPAVHFAFPGVDEDVAFALDVAAVLGCDPRAQVLAPRRAEAALSAAVQGEAVIQGADVKVDVFAAEDALAAAVAVLDVAGAAFDVLAGVEVHTAFAVVFFAAFAVEDDAATAVDGFFAVGTVGTAAARAAGGAVVDDVATAFEVEDAAGADFSAGVVDGAVALEKHIARAEGAAITASSKQGNKQNRQQRHLCPQVGCTLCRFCGRSHGVMGRGKDAGIMPVLSA